MRLRRCTACGEWRIVGQVCELCADLAYEEALEEYALIEAYGIGNPPL